MLWKRITAQAPSAKQLLLMPDGMCEPLLALPAWPCITRPVTSQSQDRSRARRCRTFPASSHRLARLGRASRACTRPDGGVGPPHGDCAEALRRRPKPGSGFYGCYLTTLLDLATTMNATATDGTCSLPGTSTWPSSRSAGPQACSTRHAPWPGTRLNPATESGRGVVAVLGEVASFAMPGSGCRPRRRQRGRRWRRRLRPRI